MPQEALLRFLAFLLLSSFTLMAHSRPIVDIVFDIDWTLFYPTSSQTAEMRPENCILVNGTYYRMTDHAPQVLAALAANQYRISFFSGGDMQRNSDLVAFLIKRTIEVTGVELRPHRILNQSDLTEMENPVSDKFGDRYTKDLRKVNSDIRKVVVIDDIEKFFTGEHKSQLVHLSPTFNDLPEFHSDRPASSDSKYVPSNYRTWKQEREKLVYALGVIEVAERTNSTPREVSQSAPNQDLITLGFDKIRSTPKSCRRTLIKNKMW